MRGRRGGMRGREGQRAFGRRSTDAERCRRSSDGRDRSRRRTEGEGVEVHESRRRGAGIVAAEEEGGFLHVLLLAARLAHRHHRGLERPQRDILARGQIVLVLVEGSLGDVVLILRGRAAREAEEREKREKRGRTGTATRREARHRSRADERLRDRHAPRFDVRWRRGRDRCTRLHRTRPVVREDEHHRIRGSRSERRSV